jgi:hypothetical protein
LRKKVEAQAAELNELRSQTHSQPEAPEEQPEQPEQPEPAPSVPESRARREPAPKHSAPSAIAGSPQQQRAPKRRRRDSVLDTVRGKLQGALASGSLSAAQEKDLSEAVQHNNLSPEEVAQAVALTIENEELDVASGTEALAERCAKLSVLQVNPDPSHSPVVARASHSLAHSLAAHSLARSHTRPLVHSPSHSNPYHALTTPLDPPRPPSPLH